MTPLLHSFAQLDISSLSFTMCIKMEEMFLWKTFNSDSISEAKKPNEIHLLALDVF
jgi:hypothetical protein